MSCTENKCFEQVIAYRAYAIFADYDGNAPDTAAVILVESEELVKRVCRTLNEDPREYTVCFVKGHEHAKRYDWRPVVTEHVCEIVTDYESAMTTMRDG